MRRIVLLLALLASAFAAVSAAQAAYKVGISDQQAVTFTNPKFAPLKMKIARYIAPYDVMTDAGQLARWDAWITGAKAA